MCPMSVPWGQGQGRWEVSQGQGQRSAGSVCNTGQSCLTPGAREEPGRGVKAALAPAMPIPAGGQPEKSPLWAEPDGAEGSEPCQS